MRARFAVAAAVLLFAGMFTSIPIAQAAEPFELIDTIDVSFRSELVVLGDYAYVADNSFVRIIDLTTNTYQSVSAPDLQSPEGAALVGTTVYFASQDNDKLVTFDTTDNSVTSVDTNTGAAPNNCDRPSQLKVVNATRLIANCHNSGNVQIYDISGATPSIVTSVGTGSGPRGMAVNNGIVYVPNSGSDDMSVVNAAAPTPSATSTLGVGDQPEFTAYLDGKVYTANIADSTVSAVDLSSSNVTTIGLAPDGAAPQSVVVCGGRVFSANRTSGNTSVIDPSTNTVIQTITLGGANATTHVVGASGGYAYFLNYERFSVSVVNCDSRTVEATIALTGKPSKITFAAPYAYVTTTGAAGKVFVISIPEEPDDPGTSTASIPGARYVDFQFLLPDGRECTAISPARVRVGSMYQLPGVDADCHTIAGSTIAGWTIPVPHGYTGYGSSGEPFAPGLSVRVIESQRFTVVPKEPVLQFDYDANIAATDACLAASMSHTSNDGRVAHVWVPRGDVAAARFGASSPCVPDGYRLVGWNTAGNGRGETYEPGSELPPEWTENPVNHRHLYAVWGIR